MTEAGRVLMTEAGNVTLTHFSSSRSSPFKHQS